MSKSFLKLLLVTHYYPKHRGGVEIVAGRLVETLTQDHKVSAIWIASNTDACPTESLGLKCYPVSAINFFENYLHIPYPIWTFSALCKIWNGVKQAEIIHIHDYLYMGNLFTFILAKIYQKPIVITQHIGLIPYQNLFLRGLLVQLNQTLGRFILGSAEQVVFISNEVQKYFLKYTFFRYSPLLVVNGVETTIFSPASLEERRQIRQDFSFSPENKICLFVGRFVEKKGLPTLHELAKLFPQVHWIFAGWGKLDPEAWNLPNVRVFRGLSGTELAPLYQMADLLVLPSKGEGFPLVVQEAMACGTPTVVSPEVAQAYPAAAALMFSVAVEGADADFGGGAIAQWSNQLENLLYHSTQLSDLRPRVATFAAEHWSWQKCAQQYQTVFQTCLLRNHQTSEQTAE
jgi:glycosyltransferase involved in cell wall biosynthesis